MDGGGGGGGSGGWAGEDSEGQPSLYYRAFVSLCAMGMRASAHPISRTHLERALLREVPHPLSPPPPRLTTGWLGTGSLTALALAHTCMRAYTPRLVRTHECMHSIFVQSLPSSLSPYLHTQKHTRTRSRVWGGESRSLGRPQVAIAPGEGLAAILARDVWGFVLRNSPPAGRTRNGEDGRIAWQVEEDEARVRGLMDACRAGHSRAGLPFTRAQARGPSVLVVSPRQTCCDYHQTG